AWSPAAAPRARRARLPPAGRWVGEAPRRAAAPRAPRAAAPPLGAALHAGRAEREAAVPLELCARGAGADEQRRSDGLATLLGMRELRTVRRGLPPGRALGAAGLARAEPVRHRVLGRGARAAGPEHARPPAPLPRRPAGLPPRAPAGGPRVARR